MSPTNWPALNCDFVAQLVRALHRHRRGHGFSNPVESPEFFRFMRQLLKIVQQVRGSYLHLISKHRTSYNISFIRFGLSSLEYCPYRSMHRVFLIIQLFLFTGKVWCVLTISFLWLVGKGNLSSFECILGRTGHKTFLANVDITHWTFFLLGTCGLYLVLILT